VYSLDLIYKACEAIELLQLSTLHSSRVQQVGDN